MLQKNLNSTDFLKPMIKVEKNFLGLETIKDGDCYRVVNYVTRKEVKPIGNKKVHLVCVHPDFEEWIDNIEPLDDVVYTITRQSFLDKFGGDLTLGQLKRLNKYWGTDHCWEDAYDRLLYELEAFDTKPKILDFLEEYHDLMLNFHVKFFIENTTLLLENVPQLVSHYKNEIYFDQLRLNRFLVEGVRDPITMCHVCGWVIDGKHRISSVIKKKGKSLKAKYIVTPACATCSGLVQRQRMEKE